MINWTCDKEGNFLGYVDGEILFEIEEISSVVLTYYGLDSIGLGFTEHNTIYDALSTANSMLSE